MAPPNQLEPSGADELTGGKIPIRADDPGATDRRKLGCNGVQHVDVELTVRTDQAVEVSGSDMKTTAAASADVLKAEAVLNSDARRGNGISQADVRAGSDSNASGPAPILSQGGGREGGIPAEALDLPLSNGAMRVREPDLLEERNVGG